VSKVNEDSIFEGAVNKPIRDLIADLVETRKQINEIKRETGELAKELSKIKFNAPSSDLDKMAAGKQKLKKANDDLSETEKTRLRLMKQLSVANSEQGKQQATLKVLTAQRIKANKEQAKTELGLVGAFEKLTKSVADARKKYQDLAASSKANTAQGRAALKTFEDLKARQDKVNQSTGRYPKFLQKATASLKRFTGQLIATAVAMVGVNKAMQVGRQAATDFDEFNATLTDTFGLLSSDEVKEFGSSFEQGALDLIKDYGFSIEDVNKALFDTVSAGIPAADAIAFMNESAKTAIAGNTDLGVIVDGTTSILNAYGLQALDVVDGIDNLTRVQDAFFTAQVEGKTNVAELAGAIGAIAPIASKAGVSFQELLSAQSALTLGGLSTAEATTSLKGLIFSLEKPTDSAVEAIKSLNEELGLNIPTSISELKKVGLGKALRDISIAAEENEDAIAKILPNIKALTAANALQAEGLDKYDEILLKVTEDTGEASSRLQQFELKQESAAQETKRLNGELKVMSIELGRSLAPVLNSVKQAFISMVKFVQRNSKAFKALVKVLVIAGTAFATFRITQKLFNKENGILSKVLRRGVVSLKLFRRSITRVATAFKIAKNPIKGFSAALKAIPFAAILSAVVTLVTAFVLFRGEVEQLTVAEKKRNKELERELQLIKELKVAEDQRAGRVEDIKDEVAAREKLNEQQLQSLKDRLKEELALIDEQESKIIGGEQRISINKIQFNEIAQEKIDKIEKVAASLRKAQANSEDENQKKFLQKKIDREQGRIDEIKKIENEAFEVLQKAGQKEISLKTQAKSDKLKIDRDALVVSISLVEGELNSRVQLEEESGRTVAAIRADIAAEKGRIEKATTKAEADEIKERIKLLNIELEAILGANKKKLQAAGKTGTDLAQIERELRDLRIARLKDGEEKEIKFIEAKASDKLARIKGNAQVEKDLRIEIAEKLAEDIQGVRDKFEAKAEEEEDKNRKERIEILRSKADDERELLEETERGRLAFLDEAFDAELEMIEERQQAGLDIESNLSNLQGIIDARFEMKAEALIRESEARLLAEGFTADQILTINIKLENDLAELARDKNSEIERIELDRIAKIKQAEDDAREDRRNALNEIAQFEADLATKRSEEREALIDKQISDSQSQQEELKRLFEAGNADAADSLAVERRREAELEAKKIEEQKKRQKIEAGLAALQRFTQASESGDAQPLTTTIRDITALFAFIDSIGAFEKGGEVTGGEQVIRVNEKGPEFVVNAQGTAKHPDILQDINNDTFDPNNYFNIPVTQMIGVPKSAPSGTYILEQKIASLEKTTSRLLVNVATEIKNKPFYAGGDFDARNKAWIESQRMGNKLHNTHYPLRPLTANDKNEMM